MFRIWTVYGDLSAVYLIHPFPLPSVTCWAHGFILATVVMHIWSNFYVFFNRFINIQDSLLTERFGFLIWVCLLCSQSSFQNLLKSRSLETLMLYLEHGTLVLVEYLGGISDESWSAVEPTSWRSCYYDLELQIWQAVLGLLSAQWQKVS